jgi:glycosyltransferase involved in cell wall biosynthesis
MISVVIPVKNGGLGLVRCLEAISRQEVDDEVEVVIVDSGSEDGSVQRARRLGARVHEIPAEDFTHGGARNLGIELSRGEIVVFTTQDAHPENETWLATLVGPLRGGDERIAGVYGRQLPHEDAIPSEHFFLEFLYGHEPRVQRLASPEQVSFEATLFSNVNSAARRDVLARFAFADDVLMSEDQEWSRRVLLSGLAIVYEPRAVVRHSHAYTVGSAFRRFFDSGVSAGRAYVSEARGSREALRRAGARYALGEVAWLWRSGRKRWLPYAAVYESAKFAGLQLGLRHDRIPLFVKKRLSALPMHWESRHTRASMPGSELRICLVYDHLFPQTVGGAERWMRDLGFHLASEGHEVTYLTMRHWDEGETPRPPGIRVVGLTDAGRVYRRERRTLLPPLRFGAAIARHLWRHGADYDVVHMASFPYFPLLAAGPIAARHGYGLVVHWIEIWTREYWQHYAGPAIGTAGWVVQQFCIRIPHTAYCLSNMHADRLVAAGYRGRPLVLPGLYAGPVEPTPAESVDPELVVYAGRHVQEKRVDALVRGFARALERRPQLRLELYGDGPERPQIEQLVRGLGLTPAVRILGQRPEEDVADAIARAACLATASEREGYGLVVVEAAARGTPSVVVAGPENAATELVQDGVNGVVSPDPSPESLADAMLRVVEDGPKLRKSTASWFAEHASRLRIDRSLELVAAGYEDAA